jgi:hypothetical protein
MQYWHGAANHFAKHMCSLITGVWRRLECLGDVGLAAADDPHTIVMLRKLMLTDDWIAAYDRDRAWVEATKPLSVPPTRQHATKHLRAQLSLQYYDEYFDLNHLLRFVSGVCSRFG